MVGAGCSLARWPADLLCVWCRRRMGASECGRGVWRGGPENAEGLAQAVKAARGALREMGQRVQRQAEGFYAL